MVCNLALPSRRRLGSRVVNTPAGEDRCVRLSEEGLFKIAREDAEADATMEFVVSEWGFALKKYSKELYPTVGIVATMKRRDLTVWRNFETITAFSEGNTQAYTPQQYASDPEILRSALQHAFILLTEKLIDDLK